LLKLGLALCLAASVSASAFSQNKTYTVQKGDNDWTISKKLRMSVHELHLLNPKTNWLRLRPGDSLVVSAVSNRSASKPNKAAAQRKEEDEILVESLERDIFAEESTDSRKASQATQTYRVRAGDNDWVIASRVGLSSTRLRALNPNVNWARLPIGTVIRIPAGCKVKGTSGALASTNVIRSRYAKIARDSVVIRRGPGTDTSKITTVEPGLLVNVVDRSGDWYKCRFPRGTVGWVRGDMLRAVSKPAVRRARNPDSYVAHRTRSRQRRGSSEIVMSNPDKSNRLLTQAFRLRGVPYRYGMSSTRGSDCSGFTSLVYRSQGVKLPRTSREQSKVGAKVNRESLQKGDLVFFKTNRGTRINHVGIYIGDGKFIHASSGGGKVQVNSLSEGYYSRRFAGGRRVVGKKPGR